MRYVIIPLAIILYLYWIYISLINIKKAKDFDQYMQKMSNGLFVSVHLAIIAVALGLLIARYW